jgi:Tol biopolymer transport system component
MNADGTDIVNVTPDEFDNRWPRWSPDGRTIAYTSVRSNQTDIWFMNPDGSEKRALTSSPGRDEIAEWRPR